jgi:hypothetical protein
MLSFFAGFLGHNQYDTEMHAAATTFQPKIVTDRPGAVAGRPFEDARVDPTPFDSAFRHRVILLVASE